jgi:hypothetical protein
VLKLTAVGLPVMVARQSAFAERADPGTRDPTLQPRAELVATYLEGGTLDDAVKRFPVAKLAPEQVAALKEITAAELTAVRSVQARLAKAKLPELVLRRETVARLANGDGLEQLAPSVGCRISPHTNQAPKKAPPDRHSPPTNQAPKKPQPF